jgi:hypothetical protein
MENSCAAFENLKNHANSFSWIFEPDHHDYGMELSKCLLRLALVRFLLEMLFTQA